MRRRTEDPHNTPEQIADYVRQALEIADECDLEAEDRRTMLPTILVLCSNKQLFYEEINMARGLDLPMGRG